MESVSEAFNDSRNFSSRSVVELPVDELSVPVVEDDVLALVVSPPIGPAGPGGPAGYDFEDICGYSRAVRVGNQVFVSGTTARPPQLGGDAYVQAKAALAVIADALAKTGVGMQHVVRTVVYVIDMADNMLLALIPRPSIKFAP